MLAVVIFLMDDPMPMINAAAMSIMQPKSRRIFRASLRAMGQ